MQAALLHSDLAREQAAHRAHAGQYVLYSILYGAGRRDRCKCCMQVARHVVRIPSTILRATVPVLYVPPRARPLWPADLLACLLAAAGCLIACLLLASAGRICTMGEASLAVA